MKNFILAVLLSAFLLPSCSSDVNDATSREANLIDAEFSATKDPIMCQDITITFGAGLTIKTTVSWCCAGSWCIPTIAMPCYNCGVVNNSNNPQENFVPNIAVEKPSPLSIHIDDLVPSEVRQQGVIVVQSSTSIEIDGLEYSIMPGDYTIDSDGFVTLAFVQN